MKCHSIKRSFRSQDPVTDRDSHFQIGYIRISSLRNYIHTLDTIQSVVDIKMFSNFKKFLPKKFSSESSGTKNFKFNNSRSLIRSGCCVFAD